MFPIKSIDDLERISFEAKWQYFERLTAFIFEENGFSVRHNVVVSRDRKKRQFDVIAEKYGTVFVAECKKWKNRQRVAALAPAAKKHSEKCEFYSPSTKPVIVTLIDDSVDVVRGVPVVPITKLNWFLNNFDNVHQE